MSNLPFLRRWTRFSGALRVVLVVVSLGMMTVEG